MSAMDKRNFSLIKNEEAELEKRILPRFPFSFLGFKDLHAGDSRMYQVLDISYQGMQISLRDGGHPYHEGDEICGELIWRGKRTKIKGIVRWARGGNLGMVFEQNGNFDKSIKDLLCIDNFVARLRPLHLEVSGDSDFSLPANLKYWLKSDGPVELFVWQHSDGELAKFQMIYLDQFVEWEDGRGVKTGTMVQHKDHETPLSFEDEFTIEIDPSVDMAKLRIAGQVISKIPDAHLPSGTSDFLLLKLDNSSFA